MTRYGLSMRLDGVLIAAEPTLENETDAQGAALVLQREGIADEIALVRFERAGDDWIITDTTPVRRQRGTA